MPSFVYIKFISNKGYKEAGHRFTITREEYEANKDYYNQLAMAKLCVYRHWTVADFRRYGYNSVKAIFREV